MGKKRLLMFYSDNCEPCAVVDPLVKRLERELNVKVRRLEVWSDQKNRKTLEKYAGFSAVPFFYNEATGKKITGEADYRELVEWAKKANNDTS
jgi:thiol-disulfide isomerase/thioredoxin